jgi:hypothetical protein
MLYLVLFFNSLKIKPIYLATSEHILEKQEIPDKKHEIYEVIQTINEKNKKIKNIYLSNMPIILKQGKFFARANGELAMEKEKKFRLIIKTFFTGTEMDIGSNEELFWFWSKRMTPSALYYSQYENLSKTNLRTVLNPFWIMESIGINEIDSKNIEISKSNNYWIIKQNRISSNNKKVIVTIIVDPTSKNVIGRYLYDEYKKIMASTEYDNFENNLPSRILITWHEEDIKLDWNVSNLTINKELNSLYWNMPKINNSIDISK